MSDLDMLNEELVVNQFIVEMNDFLPTNEREFSIIDGNDGIWIVCSDIKKREIPEKYQIEGDVLGRRLADKLNCFWAVDIKELNYDLSRVTPQNAYNFFKSYAEVHNNMENVVSDIFVNVSKSNLQKSLNELQNPIKSLLIQAKNYNLGQSKEYRILKTYYERIRKGCLTSYTTDPIKKEAKKLDEAINSLILLMENFI